MNASLIDWIDTEHSETKGYDEMFSTSSVPTIPLYESLIDYESSIPSYGETNFQQQSCVNALGEDQQTRKNPLCFSFLCQDTVKSPTTEFCDALLDEKSTEISIMDNTEEKYSEINLLEDHEIQTEDTQDPNNDNDSSYSEITLPTTSVSVSFYRSRP